jgi:hypothetical protein
MPLKPLPAGGRVGAVERRGVDLAAAGGQAYVRGVHA